MVLNSLHLNDLLFFILYSVFSDDFNLDLKINDFSCFYPSLPSRDGYIIIYFSFALRPSLYMSFIPFPLSFYWYGQSGKVWIDERKLTSHEVTFSHNNIGNIYRRQDTVGKHIWYSNWKRIYFIAGFIIAM